MGDRAWRRGSRRASALGAAAGLLRVGAIVACASGARAADDAGDTSPHLWDKVLESLDFKAKPSEPPPAFVTRTRPDPETLGYVRPAVPHKVSPIPVKSAAEIQAKKSALDAAKDRQLEPAARTPVELAKASKIRKAAAVNE